MSDRTDTSQNGQGSGASGQGSNGQPGNSEANNPVQGQGSQSSSNSGSNSGQGSGEFDISKHPAFVALSQKLENVISDNAKYRQRIRSLAGDDESNNGQNQGGSNDAALQVLQEIRSERALNRLSAAAEKAGFRTPDLILNFVNLSEVMDDKGNISNPETVINNLKSKYPEMFRPIQEGSGEGGAGNRNRNGNGSSDMNAIIRSRVRGNS